MRQRLSLKRVKNAAHCVGWIMTYAISQVLRARLMSHYVVGHNFESKAQRNAGSRGSCFHLAAASPSSVSACVEWVAAIK